MADFLPAVHKTLKREGGWYHSESTGECANRGITVWFLRSIGGSPSYGKAEPRSTPATTSEVSWLKQLTESDAIKLYLAYFWQPARLDEVDDQALAERIFDLQVNTGQGVRLVQKAINHLNGGVIGELAEDNSMGQRTLLAIRKADPNVLLAELKQQAELYYRRLAQRPELAGNLQGWLKRLQA